MPRPLTEALEPRRARLAAAKALTDAVQKRSELESALELQRRAVNDRIRAAVEAGIPKKSIAELARLDRSRIYQILNEGGKQ